MTPLREAGSIARPTALSIHRNAGPRNEMQDTLDGIAIVGMSGRFPGAADVEALWRLLDEGREGLAQLGDHALREAGVSAALLDDPAYVRVAAVVDGIDQFDAGFFGCTPAEAAITSPEHRLFLECAWEALERAGHRPGERAGVFGGMGVSGYFLDHVLPSLDSLGGDFLQLVLGNAPDHLAPRVAYRLDLRGPAVNVQTACSTSLVAVHLACQSLLSGECDLALAGGVTLAATPQGYLYQEGGILSADGRCRPFDADAGGTVPGAGAAVVALRRLDDALADGDPILAVIRGSAINNDGARKVGYTAPSVEGQAAVIAEALAVAGVEPESVGYVEAHGTATPMGDPIEVAALARAYGGAGAGAGRCALGSLKGNLGHLDAAAGVTGLIKAVMALRHGRIPATLHFRAPNPATGLDATRFAVNAGALDWPAGDTPRRAAVSSFGMGGTNAHVVLEEAPSTESAPSARGWHVLPLSARTPAALDAATARLAAALVASPESVADVAFTLQQGRQAFAERRIAVASTTADAVEALERRDPDRTRGGRAGAEAPPVVFLFPGQGAQHPDMGAELYRAEPAFRDAVDRCAGLLRPALGFDMREALYPAADETERAAARLRETAVTQPALFTVEYALASLWMEWGVRPRAMLGHSVGEWAAACLAGVFDLEDALALVAERGRLMGSLPAGAMLAVALDADELRASLPAELSLAGDNAPRQCTVSGPEAAVTALEAELAARGVRVRRLRTSHAFHSAMMEPAMDAFAAAVAAVPRQAPSIPFVSNLTGTWITPEEAVDPGYWAAHLRETVRFRDGLQRVAEPGAVLLEVGPGQTLCALAEALAESSPAEDAPAAVTSLRHAREADGDALALHRALGTLWTLGVEVDWEGYWMHERRSRVLLPTYPFERARHWIDAPRPAPSSSVDSGAGAGLATLPLGAAASGSTLEWLVGEQLRVMARQIQLLRGGSTAAAAIPAQTSAAMEPAQVARAGDDGREWIPLTPVQHRLFALGLPDPAHFNHATLFEVRERVEVPRLRKAAAHIAEHHDALRMRWAMEAGEPRAWMGDAAGSVAVSVVDLAAVPADERDAAIERAAAEAHASLDLANGPLLRMVAFDFGSWLGSPQPGRLLVVVHHLAVDVLSWGVLLEDLENAYRSLGRGAPVRLAPRTAPFRAWAERLAAHARSGAVAGEAAFWLAPERAEVRPLPRVAAAGRNAEASARVLTVSLETADTRVLLERLPRALGAQVNDVLLAALAPALCAWAGGPVAVECEGHGREDLFPEFDVSRTMGWFTAFYPLVLDAAGDVDPAARVAQIKASLRAAPNGGIGHGLLRWMAGDADVAGRLAALPSPEVVFHYAGAASASADGGDGLFGRPLDGPAGPIRDPAAPRAHLVEVECAVADGRLHASWRWAGEVLAEDEVARAAEAFVDALRELVRSASAPRTIALQGIAR
jgi:non-ribosomal peptide synthase protein (TIGR01720 family)